MQPTPFAEANALLALCRKDLDGASDVLEQMSRTELLELADHARHLAKLAQVEADFREED